MDTRPFDWPHGQALRLAWQRILQFNISNQAASTGMLAKHPSIGMDKGPSIGIPKGPFEEAFRRPIRSMHKKSIRRWKLNGQSKRNAGGYSKESSVQVHPRFPKRHEFFQKRNAFNSSDSCHMDLKACLICCLLPLLDHHTPINTRASIQCQGGKQGEKMKERT